MSRSIQPPAANTPAPTVTDADRKAARECAAQFRVKNNLFTDGLILAESQGAQVDWERFESTWDALFTEHIAASIAQARAEGAEDTVALVRYLRELLPGMGSGRLPKRESLMKLEALADAAIDGMRKEEDGAG